MGRHPSSTQYITPIKSDGTAPTEAGPRGQFTLAAGTWFFPLAGHDSTFSHVHLQGDATVAITSATVEDTDMAPSEASDYADGSGDWIATPITLIDTGVEGTGWTNTNDVGANSAGNAGGVSWNILNHAARRMRLKVVVGTQGAVRVGAWSKE